MCNVQLQVQCVCSEEMTCLQEFHLGSESEPWLGRGRAKCSVVSGEVRAAAALALRTSLLTTHNPPPDWEQ